MALEITRTDLTPAQVRLAAGSTRDARAARRLLAIALVLEGVDRKSAPETCGMDRQTLCDRPLHRRGADGPGQPPVARPPVPPDARAEGRACAMGAGRPRPRARRRDALAAGRSEATPPGRARRGDARAQRRQAAPDARPAPPGAAAEASQGRLRRPAGVQEIVPQAAAAAIPGHAGTKPLGIWFQGEARVGRQGTVPPAPDAPPRRPPQAGLHLRRGLSGPWGPRAS